MRKKKCGEERGLRKVERGMWYGDGTVAEVEHGVKTNIIYLYSYTYIPAPNTTAREVKSGNRGTYMT